MKIFNFKQSFILFLLLYSSIFYSQNLPIVGFGDAVNYRIDTYTVPGSSGLDLHWYGGIRFGDKTGNNVMQITDGNIGIGTNIPSYKLDISGEYGSKQMRWHALNGQYGYTYSDSAGIGITNGDPYSELIYFQTGNKSLNFYTNTIHRAVIDNAGNFGIGTSAPNAKIDISDFTPGIGTAVMLGIGERGYNSSSYGFRFKTDNSTGLLSIFGVNAEVETISLFNISRINGNVGIGTKNPSSKLTVAGNIASREVKVTVDAGADFVFENNYDLPSLESVDKFIKENKHLPEIASAEEMKKDGINLSEMNIKLLQKMEEMTLYMIEQNKKIENLEKKIETILSK